MFTRDTFRVHAWAVHMHYRVWPSAYIHVHQYLCLHMLVARIYICCGAAQHHVSPAISQLHSPPLMPAVALHNDSQGRAVWGRLNLEQSRGSWYSLTLNFSSSLFTFMHFKALLVELEI